MNERAPVIIVGAGPCGLATACGLWRRGIRARVIEAAAEPGAGSRAILLWPPVLEVLEELGVLAAAEREGYRPGALCYHTRRDRTLRLPLDQASGALILRQDRTSRILEAELRRLGGSVERPLRVTEVAELVAGTASRGVRVTARGADDQPIVIEADWLIAADGARSTVRKLLDIPFEGSDFERTFFLFEGQVEGELARDEAHYYVTPAGVLVAIALPDGEVRLSGALDKGAEPSKRDDVSGESAPLSPELSMQTVQDLLDRRGPGGLRASAPSQLTTYGAPHRVAAAMRHGRCFLVGDAAHVHSPAGGQGLTLGMQDVRNLVWKLAGVIEGSLTPAVLDTYELERRAAAQQVVASIYKLTRQTLFPPLALRARNLVLEFLHRRGKLAGILLPQLAGQRIQYPDVLLDAGASTASMAGAQSAARSRKPASPKPGKPAKPGALPPAGARRPAWIPLSAGRTFRIVTSGSRTNPTEPAALHALAAQLTARFAQSAAAGAGSLSFEHLHFEDQPAGYLLVRPDDYVAASGTTAAALEADWKRLLAILLHPVHAAPSSRGLEEPALLGAS